jgi:hypothetical protein
MKSMLLSLMLWGRDALGSLRAANIAEGVNSDAKTLLSDAASATENLLVKIGSDANHFAIAGASDLPIGTQLGTPAAAEESVAIGLLGAAHRTRLMVASEAISAGEAVFAAANGKVQDIPAGAGTYYQVGVALTAASADGDIIEVDPQPATRQVVS